MLQNDNMLVKEAMGLRPVIKPDINLIQCPLCGNGKEYAIFFTDSNDGYARCKDCGIFFTDIKNICQMSSAQKDMRKGYYPAGGVNPYIYFGINQYMPKINEALGTHGAFLDIGFANPAAMIVAKENGYITTGIDINEMPDDKDSPHYILHGDFETIGIGGKFDVIWASHIFEHFINPVKALNKCYDLLNPNGIIYIAMPDLYFAGILPDILDWGHWKPKEHYIFWEKESWEERMKQTGFTILSSIRNDDKRFSAWYDFQILAQKKSLLAL